MSAGIIGALVVAALTGRGVYRSCTEYKANIRVSLTIDAAAAVFYIAVLHFAGAW